MMKFFGGIVAAIVVIGLVAGSYFFGKGQFNKPKTNPSPIPTTVVSSIASPAPSVSSSPYTGFVNPSATIAAVGEAVPAKKYSDLNNFLTDKVSVTLYASECCGPLTKVQTVKQLEYLNSGTAPWNFADNNPVAATLSLKDPANFKGNIVGTAANRYAVSFHLNGEYLIDKIFMVADWKLIAP